MELKQNVIISNEVLSTEIDNEMVLLDITSEKYFGFDEVGAFIWKAIQEHNSLAIVYEILLTEYDVDPEILKRDLFDFIRKLEGRGIVTIKPSAEEPDTTEL